MLQKSSKKNRELIKIMFGSSKIDANRILFFFGAEAYVPIWNTVYDQRQLLLRTRYKSGTKVHQKCVLTSTNHKRIYVKGNIDLEAIVTVIVGLKQKEHISENIGDLALFLSGRKKNYSTAAMLRYRRGVLIRLENKLRKKYIRKKVLLTSQKIDSRVFLLPI